MSEAESETPAVETCVNALSGFISFLRYINSTFKSTQNLHQYPFGLNFIFTKNPGNILILRTDVCQCPVGLHFIYTPTLPEPLIYKAF